jgi:hypothetical protein
VDTATARSGASPWAVLVAVLCSVGRTVSLLARRRLGQPREQVGARLVLADGAASTVFRETVARDRSAARPAALQVRFRLRGAGRSRPAHAVFRRTCVVNTPLFAGFPGFVSKLWLADEDGAYRGLYDWDGAAAAAWYAALLSRVLALVCVRGSVEWQVAAGASRERFVRDGLR